MNNQASAILLERLRTEVGECDWVEFKTDNDNPELIGRSISALSNGARLSSEREGFLIYGVESDSHVVVGTKFRPLETKKGGESLLNWLVNRLNPKWDIRVDELDVDGMHVVLLRFDAATTQPLSFDKVEWVRVNSSTRRLHDFPELARRIWTLENFTAFESEIALEDVTGERILRSLEYGTHFRLLNQPLPSASDQILHSLAESGLIDNTGYGLFNVTNLGALLLATNLAEFERLGRKAVRVVVYKGLDRRAKHHLQEDQRGYAAGFKGLIDYIMTTVGTSDVIEHALRETESAYPETAVRELVANALIHQDLTVGGAGPLIEIFEDRVEISNPGKSLVDMNRIIDDMPRSRNEKVANMMRHFRICEELGSGIDRAILEIESHVLPPPIFEQGLDSVRVTLLGKRSLSSMTRDDKVRACYQHCVLRYLARDPMSNSTLRDRLGIAKKSYSIVSRIIADAIDDGFVKILDPKGASKKFTRYIPKWA